MSEYSWNRTGEIDMFSRTLEEKLQCLTPPPGDVALPPWIAAEAERGRRARTQELLLGVALVATLVGIVLVVLML